MPGRLRAGGGDYRSHTLSVSDPGFFADPDPDFKNPDPDPYINKLMRSKQCCGSGSVSSFEFSEFRIQAKVPDPCQSRSGSNLCQY